jgi:hypothetical protein
VASKRPASSRFAAVDRRTRSWLVDRSPSRYGHMAADGSDAALSCAHRNCCSSRSIRDSTSAATTVASGCESNTTSMKPRAGRCTATSGIPRQTGAATRSSSSTTRACPRSWTTGPVVGNRRTDRSPPSAELRATRTETLGNRSPAKICVRYPGSTSAAIASRRREIPESSRSLSKSARTAPRTLRVRRPLAVRGLVRGALVAGTGCSQ